MNCLYLGSPKFREDVLLETVWRKVREIMCNLLKKILSYQLDVLFGNLTEMVAFQVEFLKTLEDGVRLVPDLEKLEKVDQFKVRLYVLLEDL